MTLPRASLISVLLLSPALPGVAGAPPTRPGETPPPAANPAPLPGQSLGAFAAIGSSFVQSNHLADLGWTEAQFSAFLEGARAAFQGKGYPFDEAARRLADEMEQRTLEIQAREREQVFAQPGWLEKYLKEARKNFALQLADSGLCYGFQQGGRQGIRPGPDDTVVISIKARAADATTELPQLSADHRRVKVAELMPGLVEGVQMMTLDSRAMFIVPPALSYGSGAWPKGVDRGSPLLFMIILHEVISAGASP